MLACLRAVALVLRMHLVICSRFTKALNSFAKDILYYVSYTPNCNAHVHILNDI